MPDLTTLANVRAYLNVNQATDDQLLSRLVSSESARFVSLAGRNIINASYTEQLDGTDARIRPRRPQSSVWSQTLGWVGGGYALELLNRPVTSVTSLVIDGTAVVAATNLGQSSQTDGYVLLDQSRIELIGSRFTVGIGNISVVYVAGYGTTAPPDVEQAVIEMVAHTYKARDRIGQISKNIGNEVITFSQKPWPDSAQSVIDAYSRIQVW